jgi:hypothetical protein
MEFSHELDFCIWILQADGVHSIPFTAHSHHPGPLQLSGFSPELWHAWLQRVAQACDHVRTNPRLIPYSNWLHKAVIPPRTWSGNAHLKALLTAYWRLYQPLRNQRKQAEHWLRERIRSQTFLGIWDELTPYQSQLTTLRVSLVNYSTQVAYTLPPVTLLLAIGDMPPSTDDLRAIILDGAQQLAHANGA